VSCDTHTPTRRGTRGSKRPLVLPDLAPAGPSGWRKTRAEGGRKHKRRDLAAPLVAARATDASTGERLHERSLTRSSRSLTARQALHMPVGIR